MMRKRSVVSALLSFAVLGSLPARAAEPSELEAMIYVLNEEINTLKQQITELEKKADEAAVKAATKEAQPAFSGPSKLSLGEGVIVGGRGSAMYADTEPDGQFPNNEFLIDDAQLNVDAKLGENAFASVEVLIAQRESDDENLRIGELYVDLEDLSRFVDREFPLTLRLGRFDIPFGEEYQTRDAIDNALISHSLSDTWGIDEGVEFFGTVGAFDFTAAVQNGGPQRLEDGDPDKALVGRLGYRAGDNLRLSASAMTTGELDIEKDECAEMWFGNLFIWPSGASEDATEFWADLYQLDAIFTWDGGRLHAFVGQISEDDDGSGNQDIEATYYAVEATKDLTAKLYLAGRYSAINAGDDGFPVRGQAEYSEFGGGSMVDDIWRLSLGAGYRWSEQLVLKTEYSFERGETIDGEDLDEQDQFAAQAAFGF